MAVSVLSFVLVGVSAELVQVQTQIIPSLKRFSIVGLPDGVVREAKDRVRCAIENAGFQFPNAEVIVSLAPASLPKLGSGFDLSIALSILAAAGVVPVSSIKKKVFLGELTLDGEVRMVGSEVAALSLLGREEISKLYFSNEGEQILSYFSPGNVKYVSSLSDLVCDLLAPQDVATEKVPPQRPRSVTTRNFSDVLGHAVAKRALQVCAAGGHNLLMVGPPGAGKTMLAERLPSILPELTLEELVEVNTIHSSSMVSRAEQFSPNQLQFYPPFRSPHHTASAAGLIGGGSTISPGEVSLAHRGVLFIDEFPEMRRDAIEALREPLETQKVAIVRSKQKVELPASFIFIAAMNPCPCGKRDGRASRKLLSSKYQRPCRCSDQEIKKYISKISGPMLDRIDIQLWIEGVAVKDLSVGLQPDDTSQMKEAVLSARRIQYERYKMFGRLNRDMNLKEFNTVCLLENSALSLLEKVSEVYDLSSRSFFRIVKLARTIADLENSATVNDEHMSEAVGYRVQLRQHKSIC